MVLLKFSPDKTIDDETADLYRAFHVFVNERASLDVIKQEVYLYRFFVIEMAL